MACPGAWSLSILTYSLQTEPPQLTLRGVGCQHPSPCTMGPTGLSICSTYCSEGQPGKRVICKDLSRNCNSAMEQRTRGWWLGQESIKKIYSLCFFKSATELLKTSAADSCHWINYLPTRWAETTRGTWEEVGLIVPKVGGRGAAGRMAPGMFWNAAKTSGFYKKSNYNFYN